MLILNYRIESQWAWDWELKKGEEMKKLYNLNWLMSLISEWLWKLFFEAFFPRDAFKSKLFFSRGFLCKWGWGRISILNFLYVHLVEVFFCVYFTAKQPQDSFNNFLKRSFFVLYNMCMCGKLTSFFERNSNSLTITACLWVLFQ